MVLRFAFACLALVVLVAAACGGDDDDDDDGGAGATVSAPPEATVVVSSPAFGDGESIPEEFTCDGEDVSPPLAWPGVPGDAASITLIMDDPDAPSGGFTHWIVFDIPGGATGLGRGVPPGDGREGSGLQVENDFGERGYGGPCPPEGETHTYRFTVYVLDAPLGLAAGASKGEVLEAMDGHVAAIGALTGTYGR